MSRPAGGRGYGGSSLHRGDLAPSQRAFLMRSLDRNDTDLAALVELNKSLHSVKKAIIKTCGSMTMLNIGQGKIKLSPDCQSIEFVQDDKKNEAPPPQMPEGGPELCVDFLLRMKLRRKLLNRLVRRINRVAHALDGEDIAPPCPPRYGDLRLHVDPEAVREFEEHFRRQEAARYRIEEEREKIVNHTTTTLKEEADWTQADHEAHLQKYMSDDETRNKPIPGGQTQSSSTAIAPPAATKSREEDIPSIDYEALQSFNDAYEKVVDPATGAFKYTILDNYAPEKVEDYAHIKSGAGIGATERSMNPKEKEAEFKRWQTSILNRIPDQPTFKELGMENRVFDLEKRLKRARQEEETKKKAKEEVEASSSSDAEAESDEEKAGKTEDSMDVDDDDDEKASDKNGDESGSDDDDDMEDEAADGEKKDAATADAADAASGEEGDDEEEGDEEEEDEKGGESKADDKPKEEAKAGAEQKDAVAKDVGDKPDKEAMKDDTPGSEKVEKEDEARDSKKDQDESPEAADKEKKTDANMDVGKTDAKAAAAPDAEAEKETDEAMDVDKTDTTKDTDSLKKDEAPGGETQESDEKSKEEDEARAATKTEKKQAEGKMDVDKPEAGNGSATKDEAPAVVAEQEKKTEKQMDIDKSDAAKDADDSANAAMDADQTAESNKATEGKKDAMDVKHEPSEVSKADQDAIAAASDPSKEAAETEDVSKMASTDAGDQTATKAPDQKDETKDVEQTDASKENPEERTTSEDQTETAENGPQDEANAAEPAEATEKDKPDGLQEDAHGARAEAEPKDYKPEDNSGGANEEKKETATTSPKDEPDATEPADGTEKNERDASEVEKKDGNKASEKAGSASDEAGSKEKADDTPVNDAKAQEKKSGDDDKQIEAKTEQAMDEAKKMEVDATASEPKAEDEITKEAESRSSGEAEKAVEGADAAAKSEGDTKMEASEGDGGAKSANDSNTESPKTEPGAGQAKDVAKHDDASEEGSEAGEVVEAKPAETAIPEESGSEDGEIVEPGSIAAKKKEEAAKEKEATKGSEAGELVESGAKGETPKEEGAAENDDTSSEDLFATESLDDEEGAGETQGTDDKVEKEEEAGVSDTSSDLFGGDSDKEKGGENKDAEMEDADGKDKAEEEDDDDDDDAAAKETDSDEEKSEGEKDGDPEKKSDEKGEEKDKKEEKEKAEEQENPLKRTKPISLAAVPTFYEQDIKRIKTIHAELMASSMHDHVQRRVAEVTRAYNTALRNSQELMSHLARAENDLKNFFYAKRAQIPKLQRDYNVKLAIAKSKWNQRREEFERLKLNQMLPSRRNPGQQVLGSQATYQFNMRASAILGYDAANAIANTMNDVVAAVVGVAEGRVPHPKFTERFEPPPAPSLPGNASEEQLRSTVEKVRRRLRASEEERSRAWRKMMKAKSELDGPHYQITEINGQRRKLQVDASNHSMFPVPHLRTSYAERVPESRNARHSLASYVPVKSSPPPRINSSDSKYSVARVRQRIAADGTVAPVSEPKKNKDGLYLRPAGRTRKGMEWDAVRGIWVPSNDVNMEGAN